MVNGETILHLYVEVLLYPKESIGNLPGRSLLINISVQKKADTGREHQMTAIVLRGREKKVEYDRQKPVPESYLRGVHPTVVSVKKAISPQHSAISLIFLWRLNRF